MPSQLLFNLAAFTWPLYQLTELPLNLPVRIYGFDFLLIACALLSLFSNKKKSQLQKPILLFSGIALISIFGAKYANPHLSLFPIIFSSLYLLRFLLYASIIYFSPSVKPYFLRSLYLIPLLGLAQYILLPDLRFLKTFGFDDHYYRLTIPFLDPNYTGAALSFIALITLSNLKSKKSIFLILFSLLALALTFSRASYFSFLLGLSILIIKRRYLIILPLALVLLIVFSPKPFGEGVNLLRTYSITSRLEDSEKALQLTKLNPLTGVGFNTLKYYQKITNSRAASGISNTYLFILATTGIAGLIAFIYLLYSIFRVTKYNTYLLSAFCSLLIHAFFNNTLFYAPITVLLFLSLVVFKENTSP